MIGGKAKHLSDCKAKFVCCKKTGRKTTELKVELIAEFTSFETSFD